MRHLTALQERDRGSGIAAHPLGQLALRGGALERGLRERRGPEIDANRQLRDAAIGDGRQLGIEALTADQTARVDEKVDLLIASGVDGYGRRSLRYQAQPGSALADGEFALKQPGTHVDHQHAQFLLVARMKPRGQDDPAWVQAQAGGAAGGRCGQVAEELDQGHIRIGSGLSLFGVAAEVDAAGLAQVAGEHTAAEQFAGVLPLVAAALGEFLQCPTAAARREDEFLQVRRHRGGRDRSLGQGSPVEVTEDSVSGVGAAATRTDLDHTHRDR